MPRKEKLAALNARRGKAFADLEPLRAKAEELRIAMTHTKEAEAKIEARNAFHEARLAYVAAKKAGASEKDMKALEKQVDDREKAMAAAAAQSAKTAKALQADRDKVKSELKKKLVDIREVDAEIDVVARNSAGNKRMEAEEGTFG